MFEIDRQIIDTWEGDREGRWRKIDGWWWYLYVNVYIYWKCKIGVLQNGEFALQILENLTKLCHYDKLCQNIDGMYGSMYV